ncbi:MAG: phosphatase PAP2 family protein [Erythrobacter sp.]
MLVGTGRFLGRGRYKAFGLILEGLGCYFFVSLLGAYLSVVICTFVTNLVDTDLVRADALLGFAWDTSVLGWSDHRGIFVVLSMAYSTLAWQPVVLMGVIVTRTAPECLWNFLAAWSLALAVTLLCFPFFPAVGNMTARGIGREDLPHAMVSSGWTYGEHILAIRKGLVQSIGRGELDGLVTFPSFHAAGAVILMAGWCQAQRIGIPFVILNFIMIVSALAIGGHYLVDVLAGIVLALACVAGVFYMPSVRTASPPPARQ